jgi:hypothetical protein
MGILNRGSQYVGTFTKCWDLESSLVVREAYLVRE